MRMHILDRDNKKFLCGASVKGGHNAYYFLESNIQFDIRKALACIKCMSVNAQRNICELKLLIREINK